ncbi:conserved exported hypothetical protein [Candidatus Sulfopaludibacter sp. SbA3]|nr:conserved exported hypothetical protein [Candidatus Sulfopaludibacter sp. SbA3]
MKLLYAAMVNLACILTGPLVAQTTNSWSLGSPMPTPRQGPFTGVIGSKIYVAGGVRNNAFLTVNEIYDTTTNTWSTGAPMPTGRWLGASAVVNNIFYAMGGGGGNAAVVEAYDPATNTWSTKAPMPIADTSMKAAVENNIIYVVGGASNGRLATLLSYNPATNVWSTLAPLQLGKSESAVGLLGSTIVGGLPNSGATTAETEGFNAATNSWTTLAPMPTARQAGCFGVTAGKLYVGGGDASGTPLSGSPLSMLEAYDVSANSWTSGLPSMPDAVVAPGSAIVGGTLYCFGAGSAGNPAEPGYNYVQIYQPAGGTPAISAGGILSAGAFGGFTSVAPGSWIEIYGNNLAADTRSWGSSDFTGINAPTSLDGTAVTIGGQSAFIDYISPGQVNALVPSGVPTGLQQITVKTAGGMSAAHNVTVNAAQPGLLAPSTFNINEVPYVVAILGDGSYALPAGAIPGVTSRPAKPGDALTLYGVGFGPVTPASPAGQLVQQLNSLSLPFQMSIGGNPAILIYYGLAPGYTGLYQFDVTVPSVAPGAAALTFSLNGIAGTQTLYLAVGN